MSDNPFMKRASSGGSGRAGRASEKRVAKEWGATEQPASGALEGAKGDLRKVTTDPLLVECKSTVNESVSLKYDWLRKIAIEAKSTNSVPVLHLSFVTSAGLAKPDGEWVAIPMWFARMIEELR